MSSQPEQPPYPPRSKPPEPATEPLRPAAEQYPPRSYATDPYVDDRARVAATFWTLESLRNAL
ncbi:MAG TPA: hypothetical protein VGI55_05020, partial [Solirubrobacteraceae bacterium]